MANQQAPTKTYKYEKEGQIAFFEALKITADVSLTDNTDGVYKGTLFEFKLSITNINTVLFQAIKYLSRMRIKGESVPSNVILVSLNTETAYVFSSGDFLTNIEQVYIGAASKNNKVFSTNVKPRTIVYNSPISLVDLLTIITTGTYTRIHIDMFCVVGWAERFYNENPKATKISMFDELREPRLFADFIYPWTGNEDDFKYIMDCLNDKIHRKELGAFYTPRAYCLKATELVRRAIRQIPKGHDYIILDRCAGTGNLEEYLTDKDVDKITISELDKYVSAEFKSKYLKDKSTIISTFYDDKNFNYITCEELEKYKTGINIHDYLFDNELSHVVVNTFELKEWIVLNDRIGDKVKMVIPPPCEIKNTESLVNGGDALSQEFILGKPSTYYDLTSEYYDAINQLNACVKDPNTNIIMYENPPYRDSSAGNTTNENKKDKKQSYAFQVSKGQKELNGNDMRDLANQFIWGAWKYYLSKPNDCYILFSPVKYWKTAKLSNKKFVDGFLFNRKHFHATASSISCILWQNIDENVNIIPLKALDILDEKITEIGGGGIEIRKCNTTVNSAYVDKRQFPDDVRGIVCKSTGEEDATPLKRGTPIYNANIIAHLQVLGYSPDPKHVGLLRCAYKTAIEKNFGFYLRSDNFMEKLPLFCAKLYPQKNWYERDVYFTTADGGTAYVSDSDFLRTCLIFTCLSQRNHCLSSTGSDGRNYRNELCFDSNTLASEQLKNMSLTSEESRLLDVFRNIIEEAKQTKNYNTGLAYGTYQIDTELNTRQKDGNNATVFDYPALNTRVVELKNKLSDYYESVIQPKLFEYKLLK